MNWYKFIWLDAIERIHSVPSAKSKKDKNSLLLMGFALAQVTNLLSINIILFLLKVKITTFSFTNSYFLNFLILITIPLLFIIFNYFNFFYKDKYVELVKEKESYKDGKPFFYYIYLSIGISMILFFLL